jgi:hypothetical protein
MINSGAAGSFDGFLTMSGALEAGAFFSLPSFTSIPLEVLAFSRLETAS